MTFADFVNLAQFLGLTPSSIFPLILLGGVVIWVGYKFISPIKKSIRRISNACIEIQTIFENNGTVLRHHLVEAPGSPLQPTPYGEKLIKESGLEKILDEQKGVLIAELKKQLAESPTEYDVQEKARGLLIAQKDDSIMNPVKEYAYKNGLNVEIILKAGGLWLRDDFLSTPRQTGKE